MTGWADGPLAAFDLETTGVDPETARIITASILTVGGDSVARNWLADPGVDIPEASTEVHGITTEHARTHGRPAGDVVREITEVLSGLWADGVPVVIYNAAYDLTVLDRETRRHHGVGVDVGHVVDPLVLDRAMDRYRKGSGVRKLSYVCGVYGVPLSEEDAHSSDADALAAARVAWKIAKRYPRVGQTDLVTLQSDQRAWHRDWADNFGKYLTGKGRPDDVSREWPLCPVNEKEEASA